MNGRPGTPTVGQWSHYRRNEETIAALGQSLSIDI
jgi:hypothetical protein